jgi:hypothetical protein
MGISDKVELLRRSHCFGCLEPAVLGLLAGQMVAARRLAVPRERA